MLYEHDIAGCFAETIKERGLAPEELAALLGRSALALEKLRQRHGDGNLPLLRLPARRDDLPELTHIADAFRRFDEILVLGTGGSSLGGRTLAALADPGRGPKAGAPRLHFMDNIDPTSFAVLLGALDPARTGIIAISKSGGTAETLCQLVICLDWLRQARGGAVPADHCLAITEPRDSALRRLAMRLKVAILDHDPAIGGRFCVLSAVGLLPAMLAGVDASLLREGARSVLDATLKASSPREAAPALGAAVSIGLAERRGIAATVLMSYCDRLAPFGLWFRQLWAESLGKNGKGTLPAKAMGTVDQHSQLQLYLDGPHDKMFSLVMLDRAGSGTVMAPDLAADPDLAYLAGRRMGDLLDAEQRATAASLIRNQRPTRIFRLAALDALSLGALLMHFMLETIIAADLLGVDAFDQPAVEEGKILARQYLGAMPRGEAE